MAVKTTYTCDICGAVKGQTNHWYMASVMLAESDCTDSNVILLWPFAASKLNNKVILCGQACVSTFVSQNLNILAEGTEREASLIEPPSPLTPKTERIRALNKFLGYEETELPSYEKFVYRETKPEEKPDSFTGGSK